MSAIFDKNLERIRALEKQVTEGKLDAAKAEKRITKLREVPDYWVKVYAGGPNPIRRQATPSTSLRAAQQLEKKLHGEIASGSYIPDDLMKATIGTILDAYLEKQKGKAGEASCRSRAKVAAPVRHVKLEAWHNNIRGIIYHLDEETPAEWSDKSIWNYAKMLQYAIQAFIDRNQKLNIKNPVLTAIKDMELEEGTNRRTVTPADHEVRQLVAGGRREAARDPRLAYFPHLLTELAETGLREIEVLSFRWEKLSLDHDPARRIRPWVEVQLAKKKRKVSRRIPLSVEAARAIREWQAAQPGQTETGWVWPVRNFPGKIFRRVRAAEDLDHLIPHDLRRYWRRKHLDKGQELRKEVGGHDTDEMDEYYLNLSLEQAQAFYEDEYRAIEEAGNAL